MLIINEAYACLTADAVMEYSFAENYNYVEEPDFYAPLNKVLEVHLGGIHIATNLPGLAQLQMENLPKKLVTWLDPGSDIVFRFREVSYHLRVHYILHF